MRLDRLFQQMPVRQVFGACGIISGMFTGVMFIASCYTVALVFETLRLVLRHRWYHSGVLGSATVGFFFHTWLLYQQHVIAEYPLGGAAMVFFVSAWGLVLIYLLWLRSHPNIPFGVIVLPLALLLIGSGYFSASTFETSGLTLRTLSKMLHTVSAAGFVIASLVFVISGLLYVLESRLLRQKRLLSPPIKLPSLEWSSTIATISLAVASCCLTLAGLTIALALLL